VDLRDSKNLLLRQLSATDRVRLEPHFTEEPLAFKQPLLDQRKPAPSETKGSSACRRSWAAGIHQTVCSARFLVARASSRRT
jgi:hypothetical protein